MQPWYWFVVISRGPCCVSHDIRLHCRHSPGIISNKSLIHFCCNICNEWFHFHRPDAHSLWIHYCERMVLALRHCIASWITLQKLVHVIDNWIDSLNITQKECLAILVENALKHLLLVSVNTLRLTNMQLCKFKVYNVLLYISFGYKS